MPITQQDEDRKGVRLAEEQEKYKAIFAAVEDLGDKAILALLNSLDGKELSGVAEPRKTPLQRVAELLRDSKTEKF